MHHSAPHIRPTLARRRVLLGLGAAASTLLLPQVYARPVHGESWPLWQVEGNGGRAYLFGETPPRAKAWHDPRIERLMPDCSSLWTETNHVWRGKPQDAMARNGMDSDTPLLKKISTSEQTRLQKAAALVHMPLESMAPFRPWAAAMTIESAYYASLHHAESGSAENVLIPIAKKAGVALASEFDSQDEVVAYMGGLSAEQDAQFLSYTLDQILAGPAATERIHADWGRGDAARADAVVAGLKARYPALYEHIVIGRNRAWVPRFNDMLQASKPAMVVLGLYHMAGPDSVIMQLREAGLSVTRI